MRCTRSGTARTSAPPKDYDKWEAMIEAFARHLVERYGIDEVAKWYFEVWNEPNIDFWAGNPQDETYFQLYDEAARSGQGREPAPSRGRSGHRASRLGRTSSSRIRQEQDVPVDFVSTHVYGNDKAEDVFGTHEKIPRNEMVCRAVKKVHDQIKASANPKHAADLERVQRRLRQRNGSHRLRIYMGPWMADTIRECDGLDGIR